MIGLKEKYHILGLQERALEALANNENGAEYGILEQLSATLLSGEKVGANFQLVANAIVAKTVLCGKLPLKKRGRPENPEGVNACDVAIRYFELKDNGVSYEDAVTQIATELHKEERHIMRLVKEGKPLIGSTPEQRKNKREWWAYCGKLHKSRIAAGEEPYLDKAIRICKEAEGRSLSRDPIAELEDVIDSVLKRVRGAGKGASRTRNQKKAFSSSHQIKAVFDGTDDSELLPRSDLTQTLTDTK